MTYKLDILNTYSIEQLQKVAIDLKIEGIEGLDKQHLIYKIIDRSAETASVASKEERPSVKEEKGTLALKSKVSSAADKGVKRDKEVLNGKKSRPAQKGREVQKTVRPPQKSPSAPPEKEKPAFSIQDLSIRGMGVIEVMSDNYGFLRSPEYNYLASPDDTYVSHTIVKQLGLKTGDTVEGNIRPPREGEKYFGLIDVERVNGRKPDEVKGRVSFKHLTSLFPQEKLNIITKGQHPYGTRFVDLFSPIGKGQRGLIVAQPKTGKTYLLKDIANGIAKNHPEVYLMILLIGERPEEVTDMKRSVKAEVVASTFMQPAEEQIKVALTAIEKAKRLAECKTDVVILLDSVTRLARAFNAAERSSGKTGTGGIEYVALKKTQELFGTGNNFENGGSVTILATALVETGSRMDDIIFEELKGTGNMELQLDRKLANRGIYPAIDILKSSTRRNELMQPEEVCKRLRVLRQVISEMSSQEAIEFIIKNMKDADSNEDFLAAMYRPA